MISILKLGIAVVCLIAAAVFIAFDMYPTTPAGVPTASPVAVAPVVAAVPALPLPAPVPAPIPALVIPPLQPPPVKKANPALVETLAGGVRVYTVVQGDTLYGISVKVFGTPRHYERIYEANREKISDPNTVQIGLKLALPDVPTGRVADSEKRPQGLVGE